MMTPHEINEAEADMFDALCEAHRPALSTRGHEPITFAARTLWRHLCDLGADDLKAWAGLTVGELVHIYAQARGGGSRFGDVAPSGCRNAGKAGPS